MITTDTPLLEYSNVLCNFSENKMSNTYNNNNNAIYEQMYV